MHINARIEDERKKIISFLKEKGVTHDKNGRSIDDLYLLDLTILKKEIEDESK